MDDLLLGFSVVCVYAGGFGTAYTIARNKHNAGVVVSVFVGLLWPATIGDAIVKICEVDNPYVPNTIEK